MRSAIAILLVCSLAACAGVQANRSESYNARKALAREMIRRAEWGGAFNAINALHRDDPADPEVLALRGVVYREQRLLQEAEADLLQALELDGDDAFAHSNLAIVLDRAGRRDEALAHHRKATELEPKNAQYLNNLGFALLVRGEKHPAIDTLRQALSLDPTSSRIRNNVGFAYASVGSFAKAAEQFRLGGRPAEARNNLGVAYQAAGNLGQAFDLYVEALRLDPSLAQARQNLLQVSNRLQRPIPPDLAVVPSS
jgi:Flp pilus assembly protein TadD